ncbi:N-6 DNA methylase [Listeria seeligeri]|uniref:HsdM family class I SAM-dependent methyltransferase n=1 Tax=Listeria seeligeri TaxID=1640 RepID=UPI00162A1892|nr:N-6 DNA methylase [Listeria seeligeri]MBC2072002.1 N-6 DNA methylase [Listeria seeligeri]MBC2086968.1 N-6 DNA methylase [Listeria seeligeri]MBC2247425.1 N-6 DNA methylase [Listeria seeligeri]MBF2376887.1 N-6 DNA methylase [Listeria seeligeri]MBF2401859.1 N-6 DNA methylase [Listeria seeligeri]
MNWKLENDVNDWVKGQFDRIGLVKHKDYNEESAMSEYLKDALKGSAKTKNKTNFGKPDFHVEKYKIPVIIEDKVKLSKLVAETKDGVKFDDKSIGAYATNGALHYARRMIDSEKYNEVIAVGIAGDNADNVTIRVYYVFGSAFNAHKLTETKTLDFLENEKSFEEFYKEATLSEEEKHKILITSQLILQSYAKKLNKLMHNHNVTAPQRVLYVSGMLLAMQDIVSPEDERLDFGLIPDDLRGLQTKNNRDGEKIVNHISNFLEARGIDSTKRNLMLSSFKEISKDSQRDEVTDNDKEVAKFINGKSSVNKQIFTFIYEYIFKSIDGLGGHIDIMGEMYSEFLKYALGDGKEIGIVLTPPYVTKMMAQILGVNMDSKVMDLATGSAGFLISAMELMIEDANKKYGRDTTQAKEKIASLKMNNLLGIELNAEMYTLATTNMILRGDGSSRIEKGSAFNRPEKLFTDFKANRILLNPPFSFDENGLPFISFGLDKMKKGGLGAIIIQDSAGSGKAVKTAKSILKKHTLLASIKMPIDLFVPMAGVQTSIYIFEAHKPHDFEQTIKFIDFRNDGYKRAKRGISEVDNPIQRYQDIIKIYKAGKSAKVSAELWDLKKVYIEDFISENGNDWNFEQHQVIDTKPTLDDFKHSVAEYLSWEVNQLLKSKGEDFSKKA